MESGKTKAQVFSSGGGTQSCAIAALIVQGRLPKPDICVIADTGYENHRTWEYLDAVVRPALQSVGLYVHRVTAHQWAAKWTGITLGCGAFSQTGKLSIPAYTDIDGPVGKLPTFCSNGWKQDAVDRWLSVTQGLTRSQFVKWIGFSRDEVKRVFRMAKGEEYLKGLIRFPLVRDVPTTRQEAIQIVEDMGWPTPPRSRCWMCPNQNDHEWREIKADPCMWELATGFDDTIRLRDPHAFCHKSGKPLREVDFREEDDLFAGKCESGGCFL